MVNVRWLFWRLHIIRQKNWQIFPNVRHSDWNQNCIHTLTINQKYPRDKAVLSLRTHCKKAQSSSSNCANREASGKKSSWQIWALRLVFSLESNYGIDCFKYCLGSINTFLSYPKLLFELWNSANFKQTWTNPNSFENNFQNHLIPKSALNRSIFLVFRKPLI
jgi:hypothetical protein